MCDMIQSYIRHDLFICVPWFNHMCDLTHSYVWHDSIICATWLIHTSDMTQSYLCCNPFMCVTWPNHVCDMTQWCVWNHSFIYVHHDSFIYATSLIHKWHITQSYVWPEWLQNPMSHTSVRYHASTCVTQ